MPKIAELCLFFFRPCLGAKFAVQYMLSYTYVFRSYFQKLVVADKFKTLFKTHTLGRNQTQRFVAGTGTGVGQMLCFADVYVQIFVFGTFADNHSFINRRTRAYEQSAASLRVVKPVSYRFTGFESD